MLTKIMFRTCILMLFINLIACVPDETVVPKYESDTSYSAFDADASQPPVAGIPEPVGPTLYVQIQASDCIIDGATLLAVNPSQPGSPAYSQSKFAVKWYRNGLLIGTGAQLSECICGNKIVVKVENTETGAKGSASYEAKPCKAQTSVQEY